MSGVIDLAERRAPVTYTVTLTHHWDGRLEVFVAGVAADERSRASVGNALARAAASFGAWPLDEADELNRAVLRRIDALMGAEANTPEGRELSELAGVVQAYEAKRYPARAEVHANAELIAAAPELLAAVDALYQRLPDELARDMGWVESLLDRCGKPYRAESR